MPPNSACTSASRSIAPPPSTQEISAAGPATADAANAPSSHPDPMIEPTEVNSRPTRPTSRRNLRCAPGAAVVFALSTRPSPLTGLRPSQADDLREPTGPADPLLAETDLSRHALGSCCRC